MTIKEVELDEEFPIFLPEHFQGRNLAQELKSYDRLPPIRQTPPFIRTPVNVESHIILNHPEREFRVPWLFNIDNNLNAGEFRQLGICPFNPNLDYKFDEDDTDPEKQVKKIELIERKLNQADRLRGNILAPFNLQVDTNDEYSALFNLYGEEITVEEWNNFVYTPFKSDVREFLDALRLQQIIFPGRNLISGTPTIDQALRFDGAGYSYDGFLDENFISSARGFILYLPSDSNKLSSFTGKFSLV